MLNFQTDIALRLYIPDIKLPENFIRLQIQTMIYRSKKSHVYFI